MNYHKILFGAACGCLLIFSISFVIDSWQFVNVQNEKNMEEEETQTSSIEFYSSTNFITCLKVTAHSVMHTHDGFFAHIYIHRGIEVTSHEY